MFSSLKKMFGGKEEKKTVLAPAAGKAVSLKEVNDPTFSQEILGKGVAIIPSEGKIVAPADGTISVFFETKHAVSISAENGAEIIVHVGLDTVNLKGEHFTAHKQQGDKVKAGEILGFLGDTGYGEEGTRGKFPPHLHLGIYIAEKEREEYPLNPYPVLQFLQERQKNFFY